MRVRLTVAEFEYLRRSGFLGQAVRSALMRATSSGQDYVAELSPEEADTIRDACGEQLQRAGFDEGYKTTEEGTNLESLIDKLLVR